MMNSGGLFMQTNNADALLGNFLFSESRSTLNVMTKVAIDYASLEEMVPGVHANVVVDQHERGCYYGVDKTRAVRTIP